MSTGIPYVDETWNPVVGCSAVSEGCRYCYAEQLHTQRHKAYRAGKQVPKQYAEPFKTVQCLPDRLGIPAKWRKPRRIMVCSMADIFHDDVPSTFIGQAWGMMRDAKQHTFLVFTKRIERAERMLSVSVQEPAPNIQLIVSVEDQKTADERIPLLLDCPVAVRGVSYEPALRLVHFTPYPRLDWVIFGGESGPNARPCELQWARGTRDWCRATGTAFYMKQLGSYNGRDHAKFETFPKELQVRAYPKEGQTK
jgi:protein gp37